VAPLALRRLSFVRAEAGLDVASFASVVEDDDFVLPAAGVDSDNNVSLLAQHSVREACVGEFGGFGETGCEDVAWARIEQRAIELV